MAPSWIVEDLVLQRGRDAQRTILHRFPSLLGERTKAPDLELAVVQATVHVPVRQAHGDDVLGAVAQRGALDGEGEMGAVFGDVGHLLAVEEGRSPVVGTAEVEDQCVFLPRLRQEEPAAIPGDAVVVEPLFLPVDAHPDQIPLVVVVIRELPAFLQAHAVADGVVPLEAPARPVQRDAILAFGLEDVLMELDAEGSLVQTSIHVPVGDLHGDHVLRAVAERLSCETEGEMRPVLRNVRHLLPVDIDLATVVRSP